MASRTLTEEELKQLDDWWENGVPKEFQTPKSERWSDDNFDEYGAHP